MPKQIAAGFWSYVYLDDEHEGGRISRLRERLERSIRFYSGNHDFRIFQSKADIGWGESWKRVIDDSLGDALLLFPVLTPAYFLREACRNEALSFQRRQEQLGRDDLILPLYYLKADPLEDGDAATLDPQQRAVAALLSGPQAEDWRALRETVETDPAYGRAIERLAQRAVEALKRSRPAATDRTPSAGIPGPATPGSPAVPASDVGSPAEPASKQVSTAADDRPGNVVTVTVHPMPGRAAFTTITEAIARAPAGARILVAPGHYRENLLVNKPLELIGDGPREDIVVEAHGPDTLAFDTNIGVVRNFTLRQRQVDAKDYCVWVKQGRLELEDCDLSSTGLACLAVMMGADPRVRRNRIHGGNQAGVLVYEQGRGTYEENEISGHLKACIDVRTGADPVVRRNRVHDGKGTGMLIQTRARGVFEDNEVFGNSLAGLEVATGAEPIVRRNRIREGRASGIFVHDQARGTYEDNDVSGNAGAGIEVATAAEPIVRRNRVHEGHGGGIFVHDHARGTYEDNEVCGNSLAGIEVATGAEPLMRRNKVHGGRGGGIRVRDAAKGIYEDNEVFENALNGFLLESGADPIVRRNKIHDQLSRGVIVLSEANGVFESNDVVGNAHAGVQVRPGGNPTVRHNRITGNGYEAVWVQEGGAGTFEDNDLRDNARGPWDIHPSAEPNVIRARNQEA